MRVLRKKHSRVGTKGVRSHIMETAGAIFKHGHIDRERRTSGNHHRMAHRRIAKEVQHNKIWKPEKTAVVRGKAEFKAQAKNATKAIIAQGHASAAKAGHMPSSQKYKDHVDDYVFHTNNRLFGYAARIRKEKELIEKHKNDLTPRAIMQKGGKVKVRG